MKGHNIGYLVREGFRSIGTNRLMSFASVLVLVSCLIITAAAWLISMNVNSLIGSLGDENVITVYLLPELSEEESAQVGKKLGAIENTEVVSYRTKEEVLGDYREKLGEDIFQSMQGENNPFGNEYKVRLKDLSGYDKTVSEINRLEGIDTVSDRSEAAGRLTRLNYFVTGAGTWIVLILAAVTVFIIANTIRMTMYSRRSEISIMRSVGATSGFIIVPFIIEAVIIGFVSGVIASVIVISVYEPIRSAASGVLDMISSSTVAVGDIWLPTALLMIAAGVLIGVIGSLISIPRYLKKEGSAVIDR